VKSFFRPALAVLAALLILPVGGFAQSAPRPGSLRIVVRDETNLPIAGAKVSVTAADGVAQEIATGDNGTAQSSSVAPGRVLIVIEAPGFEPLRIENVDVRSGNRTTRDVTLKIAGFLEDIEVLPADADRQLADAFTTALSEDQIAALPEDPDELAEVLAQLIGADADIRVDGFLDATLPPGTQIQSIVIRYDAASAGSSGGGPRVEIRTQPGGDRWRGNMSVRVRDEALNARNAFASTRPDGQTRQLSWSLNGPLVKNRTGLSINVDRSNGLEQRAIRASTPSGIFSTLIGQPNDQTTVSTRLEHAITPSQRLRIEFRHSGEDASQQGLGEFDLPERAFTRTNDNGELRIGHNATLRKQIVHDFRLQLGWSSSESTPQSSAVAVRIPGALNFGGAQTQGGRTTRDVEIEDELMFTFKQRHQMYTGINVSGTHYRGDEWRNADGTFTFASLDDFAAGRATTFTQRLGDPSFAFSLYRVGAFIQDDFRVRKNLVFNFGIRHELESHMSDWVNLAPRLGVNWTPSPRWRTALRAGFTVNYQPLPGNVFEQTLLVNGERQRDLVIVSPTYPDPFAGGVVAARTPPGIIRAAHQLVMPLNRRVNVGVDQPIGKTARLRASYSRQVGRHLFRSIDRNAPVDGVRPDTSARNITEVGSTARSLNQSLEINASANYPQRRLSANASYTYGSQWNDTDNPLTLPPDSFDLDNEWGPSRQDIRHRFQISANSDLRWGFRLSVNARAQSASPYTITTGLDTNGDGVNNERPDGTRRNSARGSGTRNVDMTLTWNVGVGERAVPPSRGRTANPPPRPAPLVRFELYIQANNALNLVNAQSYSGVMTSQFFGQPTSASAPRRISVGSRVYF
jgi:hypothetical protein